MYKDLKSRKDIINTTGVTVHAVIYVPALNFVGDRNLVHFVFRSFVVGRFCSWDVVY
jgi:hypothetical protein